MNASECVLVYLKFPEQGNVKTRLARTIGSEHAVALYRCFILDILAMLRRACPDGTRDVWICYAPESAEQAFRQWLGTGYRYVPQRGHELGDRMNDSFQQVFKAGYTRAVLLGSDLPDLPVDLVTTAFAQLDAHDVVIGPSDDGGYYLIGFRQQALTPVIFQGLAWSTNTVYADTLKKIHEADRTCFTLPEWPDVDVETDLRRMAIRNRGTRVKATHTLAYMERHQLIDLGNLPDEEPQN